MPNNYIFLTKEDLEILIGGGEVSCDMKDGSTVYIAPEPQKEEKPLTDSDWDSAIQYLNTFIAEYASIGPMGQFALYGVLIPLKKRYDSGERTPELYKEMMEVE